MSYHYHHVNHYCGCYYLVHPSHYNAPPTVRWLPQVALSAHTTILSTTSRTVLTQTFSNPSSSDIIPEATYTFPLYDGVGVVGFSCRIGERVIRGVVKEKTKAKAVYDEAVARGETAGLLTQLPESSDVFTTKIGNIPASQKVVMEITYFGELKHDAEADGIRFTIPTRIAPRYGDLPGGIVDPGSDSKSRQAAEAGGGIQITVDVALPSKSNIRGIQSPSHPIAVTMGSITAHSTGSEFEPNKGAATLSLGKAELEKDFVLLVLVPDIAKPQALLESHPTIPNQRALMVTLVPKFALPPSKPEVVFIVDRSGSMSSNIPTLISALKVFLKSIPVGVKFNICSFGSSYSMLWKRSKSYGQDTLKEAVKHIEKFSANMGGTEMFPPVKAVIENRYKDMALEVMLLTDGEIWNQQELFSYLNKEVQESEAPIRIFTLGIGNAVSHSLIEGIARAGNGFSQAVGLDEKLDGKVVRMLKGGLSPHIKDYNLEVKYEGGVQEDGYEVIEKVSEGLRVFSLQDPAPVAGKSGTPQKKISLFDEDVDMDRETTPVADPDGTAEKYAHLPEVPPPTLLQAPARIPPLFPFSRTVVYLLMSPQSCQRTPKSVVLRGTSSQGPLELEIPVQVLPYRAETIHQLAARKAVGELEEGRGWIFDAKDQGGVPVKERFDGRWEDIVEREAVRLGVEFQVGGKWCSFVAVEANDAELAEKERARVRAADRRDSEKVLVREEAVIASEIGSYDFCGGPGGSYTPQSTLADDTRSVASSAVSTGTFTSASTAPSAPPCKKPKGTKYSISGPQTIGAYGPGIASRGGDISGRGRGAFLGRSVSRGLPVDHSLPPGLPGARFSAQPIQAPAAQPKLRSMRQVMPMFQLHSAVKTDSPSPHPPPPPAAAFDLAPAPTGYSVSPGAGPQASVMSPEPPSPPSDQRVMRRAFVTSPRSNLSVRSKSPSPPPPQQQQQQQQQQQSASQISNQAAPLPTIKGGVDGRKRYGGEPTPPPDVSKARKSKSNHSSRNIGFFSRKSARKEAEQSPSSASPAEENDEIDNSPIDPTQLLHKLIDLQTYSGSWDLTSELCALLGVKLSDAKAKVAKELWAVWATVLAIAFCELKFTSETDVWDLVADKARDWLQGEVKKGVVEGLEGEARAFLAA